MAGVNDRTVEQPCTPALAACKGTPPPTLCDVEHAVPVLVDTGAAVHLLGGEPG